MIRRTITIEIHESNLITVREGERYADRLCWDEAIGQVVTLTHPDIKAPRYQMRDATEQRLHEELHAARMAEIQAAHDVERIQRELRERAPTLPF
jgi:hypothetical protein